MSDRLLSVGLDVGTTSTQLVVSELMIENKAGSFAVPEMVIADRRILYKSPVHFTPLLDDIHVDGSAIREIVAEEYRKAGIRRQKVDTGAIIITGETSRKENARAVLEALADFAGEFVVTTAGPDLESVLAAKGAGAVEESRRTGRTVLHMDIGGGTSNLALIREGTVVRTGCLNVGGRLIKVTETGEITYVSPVLSGIADVKVGDILQENKADQIAQILTRALEMAAGLREEEPLMHQLLTRETEKNWTPPSQPVVLSFSGGVADCIRQEIPWQTFGDIGPTLGQTIRRSRLCQGSFLLGRETIRATVIGAGCHSTQLSGSTVFHQNIPFPMKNLPVLPIGEDTDIRGEVEKWEVSPVLALPGLPAPSYSQIIALAERLAAADIRPLLICLEQDMAKALGQALAVRLPPDAQILCLDRVKVREGSFLDIGAPVGAAMPVVVKTLVLER